MKKWLVQTETSDNRVGGDMWEWGSASLPPASAGLQPGHELLGCLVLQVGAHVAGVGAVCVPSKQTPAGTHRSDLHTFIFQDCIINKRSCWSSGSLKHNRNQGAERGGRLTRFSLSSSATGQSPAPSASRGIYCSRWKRSPLNVSSCWRGHWVQSTPSSHSAAWKEHVQVFTPHLSAGSQYHQQRSTFTTFNSQPVTTQNTLHKTTILSFRE